MANRIFNILAVCLVSLLGALAFSCSRKSGNLRAGAFAADITPQVWPVPMRGTFEFRPATSAHDPLHARALVLDDGKTKLVIAVIDNVGIPREVLDAAKRAATKATGIPADHMLMASTHTHTAPYPTAEEIASQWDKKSLEPEAAAEYDKAVEANARYTKYLTEQITRAVERAAANLQPAEIGWAVTQLPDHLNNRRWFMKAGTIPPDPYGGTTDKVQMNPPRGSPNLIEPAGPTDPGLSVVSIRTADGKPLALLANYSLHYVGGVPAGQISADYFGEFARLIKQHLAPGDAAFVGILSNGTSADVNNINFGNRELGREAFEKIRLVAGSVADAAFKAYQEIEHRDSVDLAMAEREITLAVRKPTPQQFASAKRALMTKDESRLPRRAKAYAKRAIELAAGPDTTSIKLQALRIGDLGIVAIPFEVFTEIGLEIKEKSPLQPVFTMELANGSNGYLPTPEQHELGGYETWLGTNRVEINASRKITETVIEMLGQVSR